MPKLPLHHDAVHADFVAHLQARLGLKDEAATVATLGNWLSSYEPGPAALAHALPSPRRQAA